MIKSVITGTGAYIPEGVKKNEDFLSSVFYSDKQSPLTTDTQVTITKFESITGIRERIYAPLPIVASDMATAAGREAIKQAGIDPETIDYIIVAHNYGDRASFNGIGDMVPSLASRVKHNLGIQNPNCIPYDLLFGCPGWVQSLIQADLYIKSGLAKTCLVIGTDTLSRVLDKSDRDSMLFSDGSGACILQKEEGDGEKGVLASAIRSDTTSELDFIYTGTANAAESSTPRYLKMRGHKVYVYALSYVPLAMKACFDKSGKDIKDLKMIFLHQANEKMDAAIVREFYKLYDIDTPPDNIMPMNISWMGNSSVATVPTLLHQVATGQISDFKLQKGDLIMMASVGAGMNINAVVYRW